MNDAPKTARRWVLVACHFVAPLIFFTNFTRNPYVVQIVLIHAGAASALAFWAWGESGRPGGWRAPSIPAALPGALFLLVWAASWLRSYLVHPAFFRPAIVAEGARNGAFLLAVCTATFVVSAAVAADDDGSTDVPLGAWIGFALAWGLAWAAFPPLRSRGGAVPEDFGGLTFDPYGAILWVVGFAGALRLTRRGRAVDFQHLALCAAFLASAYGVLQYFSVDFIWPYILNPYGGRAVSTFGNPNFLSSYNVALMPALLAAFLVEKSSGRRVAYAVAFVTLEAALLATLTRSSWVGAIVGCAALALSPKMRSRARAEPRPLGLLLGTAVALALLWPASSIATAYTPTVVGRLTEVKTMLERDGSYSPLHQRVLIWASAWLMGRESPLLGKGGGVFELFYPFYQGTMLHAMTFFHNMRTHANNSHNEILENFAQVGLLGLGAYLAFWAAFFAAAWKWAKGRLGDEPLWIGAVAGCAGVLADNMLNVSLHFAVPAFLFWWCAGTAMGRGARDGAAPVEWKAPPAARRAAFAALALFAAGTAWLQVRVLAREAWYFAGFKRVRMSDFVGAGRALERSRAWGPREVNALYELGNVYVRTGRAADAAAAYREALDANAGYDEIYFNLATVENSNLGKPDEALKHYEVSWAINPLSNDLDNALSAAYLRDPGAHLDAALDVLQQATRDFPDNPNHWNNLGYALSLQKRWDEAQAAYERALAIAPDLALAERNLANMTAQSGRPRPAILGALSDLRELDRLLGARDYSDRTVALAASVARRVPGLAKARFIHGSLLLARGRPADAVAELEASVKAEPGRVPSRVNLGNAYLATGRRGEAEAQFRAALAVEPGNAAALERLKSIGAAP